MNCKNCENYKNCNIKKTKEEIDLENVEYSCWDFQQEINKYDIDDINGNLQEEFKN